MLFLAMAPPSIGAERYISATVDDVENLQIRTIDGRIITIPKEGEQVGFDKIAISREGTAVGWVRLFPNCCTSYPIPLWLDVYSAGESRRLIGVGLPVWNWRFSDDGKRVAFHQETVHGGLGTHYELRDVVSGALVAQWEPAYGPDNRQLTDQTPPVWVRELDRQR